MKTNFDKNISTDNLSEEFESVNLDRHWFKNRQKKNNIRTILRLRITETPIQGKINVTV